MRLTLQPAMSDLFVAFLFPPPQRVYTFICLLYTNKEKMEFDEVEKPQNESSNEGQI